MKRQQQQEGARVHLLSGAPYRHDAPDAAPSPMITKGCATFWVGEEGEAPRRVAVPVARLGHPRMLELLGEAKEEYGFAHEGAVVVPCGVERFMRAVEAAAATEGRHRHGYHHHRFRLPHIARCFRPSHLVA
ncbi:auxin-responsive protein SAUR32-like [Phragmites australis]|uniref:auxin-responsive protein SAUR32-like n=1 Tax=Phragmites australis TaxID=29695 RepID=UPI002D769A1F|nr:auxin-responsive protein SAUR32-like [Phragmites australis]